MGAGELIVQEQCTEYMRSTACLPFERLVSGPFDAENCKDHPEKSSKERQQEYYESITKSISKGGESRVKRKTSKRYTRQYERMKAFITSGQLEAWGLKAYSTGAVPNAE